MRLLVLLPIVVVLLSSCTSISAVPQTWQNNTGGPLYQFSGKLDLGNTGRRITIYVNGKSVLSGKAHYWVKRIDMTGTLDGALLAASCPSKPNECVITVNGVHAAILTFESKSMPE